jgi:hypothetical protein
MSEKFSRSQGEWYIHTLGSTFEIFLDLDRILTVLNYNSTEFRKSLLKCMTRKFGSYTSTHTYARTHARTEMSGSVVLTFSFREVQEGNIAQHHAIRKKETLCSLTAIFSDCNKRHSNLYCNVLKLYVGTLQYGEYSTTNRPILYGRADCDKWFVELAAFLESCPHFII